MIGKRDLNSRGKSNATRGSRTVAVLIYTLVALSLCACGIVRPSAPAFVAEERAPITPPLVQLDFEYEDADATAVALLWNLNTGDASATQPEAEEATAVQTKTAMTEQGNLFRTRINVPAGAQIQYSLLVATGRQEEVVEVQQAIDEDETFTAAEYGTMRIQSVQTLNQTYTYSVFVPTPQVQQEVVYRAADAGEVYLVWTVNERQLLPEAMRTAHTYATERYMYTPMNMQDGAFHAHVAAPVGVKLNYSFVTTKNLKGAPVQVWETLASDRQPVVTEDGLIDVVAATTTAEPAVETAPGDFAPPIGTFIALASLFGAAFLAKQLSGRQAWTLKEAPLVTVAATGIGLYAALISIRIYVAGIGWVSWQTTFPFISSLLIAAIPDLIYAIVVTIAFCMLLMYAWPNRVACRLICAAFSTIMVVSIAFALANAVTLRLLGQPFMALGPALSAAWQGTTADTVLPATTVVNLLVAIITLSASALLASYLPQLLLSLFMARPLAATMRKHYVYVPVGKFNRRTRGANQPLKSMLGGREEALLTYNSDL